MQLRAFVDAVERNVFVVVVLAAAGIFRVGFFGLGIGSDTWYTLVGGRIVSHSWLPHANHLTILGQGREWVDQQWLAHLALYGLWGAGGWPLALLTLLAAFLGAFAIAAATATHLGASTLNAAVAVVFCVVVAMGQSGFRAEMLAFPLFAVALFLLLADERRPSWRVCLTLPVLVLWANVHGSVVLGAALVSLRGLVLVADAARRERTLHTCGAVLAVGSWVCTIASPYGLALPGYYERLLHNPTLGRVVSEWQPATIRSEPLFFLLLLGAVTVVALGRRKSLGLGELALLVTALGGLLAVRHIVWFALTAAAVLPSLLDAIAEPQPAPRRRRLNVTLAATFAAVLVAASAAFAAHDRTWFERDYPAAAGNAAAAAAAADPRASVFADERYADWLLLEHPSLAGRLAYDARFELLTSGELTRIAQFRLEQGADWLRVVKPYRIVVLDPSSNKAAIRLLTRERGARILYRDRKVVVLERVMAR